ncbi:MAG: pyridoxal phosphate-dependent aminotransferase [Prevotellaceae bacterium]|nr:pyridoxal phosphate-dependent aminotransferase [Prevotellaceae bacterium]
MTQYPTNDTVPPDKFGFDSPHDRRGSNCYKWDSTESETIPMWVADMDFQASPAIREALRKRMEHGIFGYTRVPQAYYDSIIHWFGRRHGWHIEREWLLYTTGVVPAASAVLKALTQPGDGVILQTPAYNCFFSSIRNNGCRIAENPLMNRNGRFEIDYDHLEQLCQDAVNRVLLFCNPHNPTGRLWTKEELQRVAEICDRYGIQVISDEIHCELTYEGNRYVPFGTISGAAIILSSPSKSFNTAGLQIANIVCRDTALRRRINRAININEVCDVNPFGPLALMAAYDESEEWLNELCKYIWQNYKTLCEFVAAELPQMKITPLEATYLVWADCSAWKADSDTLAEILEQQAGVKLSSGMLYGQAGEGFLRINIACPRGRMLEGLRRMAHCMRKLDCL